MGAVGGRRGGSCGLQGFDQLDKITSGFTFLLYAVLTPAPFLRLVLSGCWKWGGVGAAGRRGALEVAEVERARVCRQTLGGVVLPWPASQTGLKGPGFFRVP